MSRIKYDGDGKPATRLPASRAEAKLVQSKTYFTGMPCKYGHLRHRYTMTGVCAQCTKINVADRLARNGPPQVDPVKRSANLAKWNASTKAYKMKQRWKEQNPKWAWVVSATGGARCRAKQIGLPFNLDNDYIYGITPDRCPVFGTPFVFLGMTRVHLGSPSLDRIIPELGYVKGNIAVISNKANAIKSSASWKEIQRVARWLKSVVSPPVQSAD